MGVYFTAWSDPFGPGHVRSKATPPAAMRGKSKRETARLTHSRPLPDHMRPTLAHQRDRSLTPLLIDGYGLLAIWCSYCYSKTPFSSVPLTMWDAISSVDHLLCLGGGVSGVFLGGGGIKERRGFTPLICIYGSLIGFKNIQLFFLFGKS